MKIWICGQEHDRCESEYFHRQCADRDGHDGKHHNGRWYWTTTEAQASS